MYAYVLFLVALFGFLLEMSECTDLNWQPTLFFIFFSAEEKLHWAAGGPSHMKITMSHTGDLCMCRRLESLTSHWHTHNLSQRCIMCYCKTHCERCRKTRCVLPSVNSHMETFIMTSLCRSRVYSDSCSLTYLLTNVCVFSSSRSGLLVVETGDRAHRATPRSSSPGKMKSTVTDEMLRLLSTLTALFRSTQ